MSASVDERARRVLRERAERLAQSVRTSGEQRAELEMAVCCVGQELFGIPVAMLREILPLPPVTRLPGTPEWLRGIAQVRGDLLSVVDLGRFYQVAGAAEPTLVAVIDGPRGAIGFTVERVLSYRSLSLAELGQGDLPARAESRATLGVTRDLVVVLDVMHLIEQPELVLA